MSPLLTLGFPPLPGHNGSWEVKLSELGFYLLLFSLRLSSVGAAPRHGWGCVGRESGWGLPEGSEYEFKDGNLSRRNQKAVGGAQKK